MSKSKLVVGIDEVGYGPNLGPLIIAASVWRVPQSFRIQNMAAKLEPVFLPQPIRLGSNHIPVGDSKSIYRSGQSHESLALGCLFFARLSHESILTFSDFFSIVAQSDAQRVQSLPWYSQSLASDKENFERDCLFNNHEIIDSGLRRLEQHQIEFLGFRIRAIDEQEFNAALDIAGNKSNILTEVSLRLVKTCMETFSQPGDAIEVFCDKHGGRKRYQSALSHAFSDSGTWFDVLQESQRISRYQARFDSTLLNIQFQVDGDSLVPSAVASIAAKFMRELLMLRLNCYWSQVSEAKNLQLHPTAGYYVDAVRFAGQIDRFAVDQGLDRDSWWRKK